MAQSSVPLDQEALNEMIAAHHLFLDGGGAGGYFQTLITSGLVFGLYLGASSSTGQQAGLDRKQLPPGQDLSLVQLPFLNAGGLYAPKVNFFRAELAGSLFTDAYLERANFEGANLQNVDFSRADLRKANFSHANLRGADFENCDLRGADFSGADLEGSRFPGARF